MAVDRRAAIGGMMAMLAGPAAAKLAPPDKDIKTSPIRWPAEDGTLLHGFMAIPERARMKQPAVLVLVGPASASGLGTDLAEAVARAGLIGCAPDPAMITGAAGGSEKAIADLGATIAWLGHNSYATGAIGLLGTAGSDDLLAKLATRPGVTASVLLGSAAPLTADGAARILILPAADSAAWAAAWPRAMAFLRERLK